MQFFFTVNISSPLKKDISAFLKKVSSWEPNLSVVDVDVPLNILCQNDEKLEQVALGREFHVSLGRTVPIRVHQIDSVISMLKQKLQIQRQSVLFLLFFTYENGTVFVFPPVFLIVSFWSRFWIDFNKWEVFVNDDQTRTFLSLEVVQGGLVEVWLWPYFSFLHAPVICVTLKSYRSWNYLLHLSLKRVLIVA